MWIVALFTFILSGVLDNLTTTLIVSTLLEKLIKDSRLWLILVSIVGIAANAGGAWTVIGCFLWAGLVLHGSRVDGAAERGA